jgi:L-threonylcarbamoyladenylate synthase
MTIFTAANSRTIIEAAQALRAGQLVIMPTETVYGLAGDAGSNDAVARIFAAKKRPSFNPLIVHVSGLPMAERYAEIGERAASLIARFWPGPLTLVLPKLIAAPLSPLVSAGLSTVALRAPAHPVAHALIEATDLALAAPSANLSGQLSATRPEHVSPDLIAAATLCLDSGSCSLGIESTVLGFSENDVFLLRPGALARADIEAVCGELSVPADNAVTGSPGRLLAHYAPHTPLRLNVKAPQRGEALLAFGARTPTFEGRVLNLSARGDLVEAAANLFSFLAELDREGHERIAVMPIPQEGLGEAINDRLTRAARMF